MSTALKQAQDHEQKKGALIGKELRPLFHATPFTGWMNDPNGFSFYKGEYHLFYQYYPYDTRWNSMHWGHLKSADLIRWEHLPASLAPDEPYDAAGCFSGTALTLKDGRQLLMYTGVSLGEKEDGGRAELQQQCLAFGDGLRYEKWDQNPVIAGKDLPVGIDPSNFRDPKILLREDGSFRALIGAKTEAAGGAIVSFRSENALSWQYEGIVAASCGKYGSMWECPDLFLLGGRRILLLSAQEMPHLPPESRNGNGSFFLISRNEKEDFESATIQAADYGIDFYAPQTLLLADGRRIMIGWLQNWDAVQHTPDLPFFGQMSVPREVTCVNGEILQKPVRELEAYRRNRVVHEKCPISREQELPGIRGRLLDLTLTLYPRKKPGGCFRLKFAKNDTYFTLLEFDPGKNTLKLDRTMSGFCHDIVHIREFPVSLSGDTLTLRLILDRYSAEIFAGEGRQSASAVLYTPGEADRITFEADAEMMIDAEKYDLAEP